MKIRKLYTDPDGTENLSPCIHDFPDQTAEEVFAMLSALAPGLYALEDGKVVYNGVNFKCTYIPVPDEA